MARAAAGGSSVHPSSRPTTGALGRVLVVHSQAADAGADEVVARLRDSSYDVVSLAMRRTLVNDVLNDDPDVIVISYVLGSFDLVRLLRDLTEATGRRIVVVAGPGVSERVPDEDFIVNVLDAGADDFLTTSTSGRMLAARLRVAMRARPKHERRSESITVGDVVIDVEAHTVSAGSEIVRCPPLQFELLLRLARQSGIVVSRDQLLRELWGVAPGAVDPRRLRIAISVLRGVIGDGPRRPIIESVSRSGYRLSVPPIRTEMLGD
jgi:DNA-binding response OmpR family regulator